MREDIIQKQKIEIETMIPNITEDGIFCNLSMEYRAIKNGIRNNNLLTKKNCFQLISLTNRILELENYNLKRFLYKKMKYLGFSSNNMNVSIDMDLKTMNNCLCGNFIYFYENQNEKNLQDLKIKLLELKSLK